MYLKVYYNSAGRVASVAEVRSALPADLKLEVDDDLGYPAVIWPDEVSRISYPHAEQALADYQRVREALQAAGFETE